MIQLLCILLTIIFGLVIIFYVQKKGNEVENEYLAMKNKFESLIRNERIAYLRHADFDKFCEEINAIRRQKGQSPIPTEFLKKVQYNLMYALEEI
ncbi:MAG: hypothetical protein AB1779_10145 [Candidatus Thermoplasmatota archaeon]